MTAESRPPWFSRWDLLPLLVALGLAAALPWLLQGLPDPMPTHFDGQGHPNGWTPLSAFPWFCFGLPAFIWGVVFITGRATVGTSQDPDGRKSAAMAPLRGLLTTGALGLMGATPLIPRFGLALMGWMMALEVGLLILGLVLMARQLKAVSSREDNTGGYRWGLFYVNAEDARIWVPKRLGVGWTLNFGHRLSWFILILLLSPAALVVGFLMTR